MLVAAVDAERPERPERWVDADPLDTLSRRSRPPFSLVGDTRMPLSERITGLNSHPLSWVSGAIADQKVVFELVFSERLEVSWR